MKLILSAILMLVAADTFAAEPIEVFAGNTAESPTLLPTLGTVRVGGKFMEFGSSLVRIVWHGSFLLRSN